IGTFEQAITDLKRRDPSLSGRLDSLEPLIGRVISELQRGIDARDKSGVDAAIANIRGHGSADAMFTVRTSVTSIEAQEMDVLKERADEATATARRTFLTIGFGTLFALIALSVSSVVMSRGITRPVQKLVAGTERIAAGELSSRITAESHDEIGELAGSFNRMAESLEVRTRALNESGGAITGGIRVMTNGSDMLLIRSTEQSQLAERSAHSLMQVRDITEQVVRTAEGVTARTEDVAARATELRASSEQVRTTMSQLFESAAKTSSSTTEMSAASAQMSAMTSALAAAGDDVLAFVSEMEATSGELGSLAKNTADLSRRAREEAVAGRAAVDETVAGIEHSRELTERAADVLADLAGRVAQIRQILEVVGHVTQRTNLLALNAAIIAAHAGEHGQGFNVVAEEMRELAEQTRKSTNEISAIVNGVRTASQAAVAAMQDGVDRIRGTVSLARNANDSLGRIVDTSASSFEMSQQISASLEQQAAATRSLHRTASKMSDHIGENRRSIDEQARAASLLAQEAEAVHNIAAQVRSASDHQSTAARGIAEAMEQINLDARTIRDIVRKQLGQLEEVSGASSSMRDIAQKNNALAEELTATVRTLAQSGEKFEQVVRMGSK
ncbi:MAG: HAMP domain-containing protein, partial [Acidobacteria bacterium]|nr:HAMP domain-containing protein [Acidobacteriota bacterium]